MFSSAIAVLKTAADAKKANKNWRLRITGNTRLKNLSDGNGGIGGSQSTFMFLKSLFLDFME
jgi:hypothetical protein